MTASRLRPRATGLRFPWLLLLLGLAVPAVAGFAGSRVIDGAVGGVATLLRNRQRDEIATRTDLSGPLEKPKASSLQVVIGLVQNAFFKAILPGLEHTRTGDSSPGD